MLKSTFVSGKHLPEDLLWKHQIGTDPHVCSVRAYVSMCICMFMTGQYACIDRYIHTYIHTYMHTQSPATHCIYTHLQLSGSQQVVCIYIYICMHACMHKYIHTLATFTRVPQITCTHAFIYTEQIMHTYK